MEQEQLTLYKLMILYLIEKVDFPLSNSKLYQRRYRSVFKRKRI